MKKWLLIGLVVLCGLSSWAEGTVTNLVVAQRAGTKWVDISYDLACDTTNAVTVLLVVSNGTAAVSAPSVTGDVGAGVAIGIGKSIVWDGGADWDGQLSAQIVYGLLVDSPPPTPKEMVAIPAGTNNGTDPDFGTYSLTNATVFYMDATGVTKAEWDAVYNWAVINGYSFAHVGSGKAENHPVQAVSWYDCVKWCNARSEKGGRVPCYTVGGSVYKIGDHSPECNFDANGYRLPTSAEREYAARGGLSGKRFPWGDTITHDQSNYYSLDSYSYDMSSTRDHHPDYDDGVAPYTSPSGTFAANGYGLYDMAGNVWEWCWDTSSSYRVIRGGSWNNSAHDAGGGIEYANVPAYSGNSYGFRAVCY